MWLRQLQALQKFCSGLQRTVLDRPAFDTIQGGRGWALAQAWRAPNSLAACGGEQPLGTAGGTPHSAQGPSWDRAAAALGAAAALCAAPALCEVPGGRAGGEGGVREAVVALWAQLNEQLHRLEASLPPGDWIPSIPEPEVAVSDERVVVTFLVPQSLDIGGAVQELRRRLRAPPPSRGGEGEPWPRASAVTEESSFGTGGRAWHFRRRSANSSDGLAVDVEEPFEAQAPARFVFTKAGGPPGEGDLELMTAVLQSSMRLRRAGRGGGGGGGGGPSLAEQLGDFGRLFHGQLPEVESPLGVLDPFMAHVRDLILELERGMESSGEFGQHGDEERDTEPTPLRRRPQLRGPRERHPGWEEESRQPPPALTPEQAKREREARQEAELVSKLQGMGAQVFLPKASGEIDWGILAGYEEQKAAIQETVLDALMHPGVYDDIARATRTHFASNRPRAVLFEGPPGTGKTTSARVIATQAAVPLVYVPLEAVMSKWYGEAEKKLADVLAAAEALPSGCILFLDELDSLATARGGDMHEATRRLLGVLLRHLDGFDAGKKTIVVGATNRKQDLDPALVSRFSASIAFGLPDQACRLAILRHYARHLGDAALLAVAEATPGLSGRDIRDLAECAERRWASKIVRGSVPKGELPPLGEYLDCARRRLRQMAGLPVQ